MGKNDSLEVDQLPFLKLDVDHRAGISNNDNFCILVSLFYCDTRLCYWLIASVDSLSQSDDTVLLGEVESHLQLVDWTFLLIDLYDTRVLKVSKHLVIDILC